MADARRDADRVVRFVEKAIYDNPANVDLILAVLLQNSGGNYSQILSGILDHLGQVAEQQRHIFGRVEDARAIERVANKVFIAVQEAKELE